MLRLFVAAGLACEESPVVQGIRAAQLVLLQLAVVAHPVTAHSCPPLFRDHQV
jgi:hypothetical protein